MTANNLPQYLTPFIGREREITDISNKLQSADCRLLTLAGPGGSGKTRLAIEVARQVDFADGGYFVPLQPLQAADNIVTAIIDSLPLQLLDSSDPRQRLLNYLQTKDLLLVLDNFEHLLDGVDIVTDILTNTTRTTLVVTSRERLNLQAEHVWPVWGLEISESVETDSINQHSAVQLFVERAQRLQPAFSLDDQQDAVIQICQLVQGLPLALELAASWTPMMSCKTIANEIQHNIDILVTNHRDQPERHQSMRAVFDHSWSLLNAEERTVFPKLAVFRGGFTADAAREVAGASLTLLAAFINKSLVQVDDNDRYDLHELVRQYAKEQLDLTNETEVTLNAHSVYFCQFMHKRERDLKGAGELQALQDIRADFENIRSAWLQAVQQHSEHFITHAVESLAIFCQTQNLFREGSTLFLAARNMLEQHANTAHSLTWARVVIRHLPLERLSRSSQSMPEAYQVLLAAATAALEIAHQHHNQTEVAICLKEIGEIETWYHHYDRALEFFDQCLEYFTVAEETHYWGLVRLQQNYCLLHLGHVERVYENTRQNTALFRSTGHSRVLAVSLMHLGWRNLYMDGNVNTARQFYAEALALSTRLEDQSRRGLALFHIGLASFLGGNFEEAVIVGNQVLMIGKEYFIHDSIGLGNVVLGLAASLQCDANLGMQYSLNGQPLLNLLPQYFFAHLGITIAACSLEEYETLTKHLLSLLEIATQLRALVYLLVGLPCAAVLLKQNRQPERAVETLALAFTHPKSLNGWLERWSLITQLRADLELELGQTAFDAAWDRGTQFDAEQIATDLLQELSIAIDHPAEQANQSLLDPLSPREFEVLVLIADGLTNREIAERLFVGVSTVKKHIQHIYSKLDARNRTSATAVARDLNLLP